MRKTKMLLCICILLTCCFHLFGCGKEKTVADVFSQYRENYGDMPCGILYDTSKKEREQGYFTDKMKSDLYARADGTSEMEHVSSAAVYLGSSQSGFCEFGIFICNSHREAEQVAKMCFRRIDTARSVRLNIEENALFASSLDDAFVIVKGNICVYSAMPDNEKSRSAIEHVL